MEYKTMTKKELAAKMDIPVNTLSRRMEKELKPEFMEQIKGKSILFENEVKYIHKGLGAAKEW